MDHAGHDHAAHDHDAPMTSMAASATLHCLTGCAIGEIVGLVVGTAAGLSNAATIPLSVALAFAFGFALPSYPLLRAGLPLGRALGTVLAADTLSIATMEVVDTVVEAVIPGALNAGLVNTLFWASMLVSLSAAYVAAYPVNRWLLARGKGHALTHEYGHGTVPPAVLAAVLLAFILGGLLVAAADDLSRR
jgi:hypothetical protein